MDPHDTRVAIDKVLVQEKKWLDAMNTSSIAWKDKDPVSASCVVWIISNGYVPRIGDHQSKGGNLKLPDTWDKGCFYQATKHWKKMGLSGYNAQYVYCSMRGGDLEHDLPSWEATSQLHRLIKVRKPDFSVNLPHFSAKCQNFPQRRPGLLRAPPRRL